jgi:hypothetical protein
VSPAVLAVDAGQTEIRAALSDGERGPRSATAPAAAADPPRAVVSPPAVTATPPRTGAIAVTGVAVSTRAPGGGPTAAGGY